MFNSTVDIITLVVLFHAQNVTGMESAVLRMSLGKSLKKLLRHLSQFHKGFSYRFQAVAYLFCLEVFRVFHLPAGACRLPFMTGYKIKLRRVDQNLMLGGFDTQYVGHVAGWGGVTVCLKIDKPLGVTNL